MSLGLRKTLWRALRIYAIAAILHSSLKVLFIFYRKYHTKNLWKHLPGYDVDIFMKRLLKAGGRRHDFYLRLGNEFPTADLVKIDIDKPALLVNSPAALKWVAIDNFENITKAKTHDDVFDLMAKWLGKKSLALIGHGKYRPDENEIWSMQRKTLVKVFSKRAFESNFHEIFLVSGNRVLNNLNNNVGEFIDMQSLIVAATMDAGYKIFLGLDSNNVENGLTEFLQDFNEANSMIVGVANQAIKYRTIARLFLPYPFGTISPDIFTKFNLTHFFISNFNSDYKQYIKLTDKNDRTVQEMVDKARADPKITQRTDVVASFIKIGADDEILKDVVRTMILAGADTTSAALSWLFYELSIHPDIQNKLAEEIFQNLGDDKIPHLEDLTPEKLPYLNGCLFETLRLHPGIPSLGRRAQCDLVYTDGTIIPKNTVLVLSPYGNLRNPIRFRDPETFNPLRWIPFQQPETHCFPNFLTGPRTCVGKDMAIFEAKMMVCLIIRKFEFQLREGEQANISYPPTVTNCVCNNFAEKSYNLWLKPSVRVFNNNK